MKTVKLPMRFDPALLKGDLARMEPESWRPHFNKADYEGNWRVAPLRALGGSQARIYSDPAAKPDDYSATPLLLQSPYFAEVLAAFQCPVSSARLMALGAGSRIREHRDFTIEYEDGDARLHVPVATSPEVEFYLSGERIVMNEGEVWYLDFGEPHRVYNGGSTERVHMVLDCVLNDWLRGMIEAQ